MLSRRCFIAGALSLAMLSGCDSPVREFVDVPPTEENLALYRDALDWYDLGLSPYDGYVPPCTREEAASAIEGMGDWTSATASGGYFPPPNDQASVAHRWLPLGTIVRLWRNGLRVTVVVTDRCHGGTDFELSDEVLAKLMWEDDEEDEVWWKAVRYFYE